MEWVLAVVIYVLVGTAAARTAFILELGENKRSAFSEYDSDTGERRTYQQNANDSAIEMFFFWPFIITFRLFKFIITSKTPYERKESQRKNAEASLRRLEADIKQRELDLEDLNHSLNDKLRETELWLQQIENGK